jgi:hypothetical protein
MASSDKAGFLRPDLPWAFRRFPVALLAAGLFTACALLDTIDRDLARRLFSDRFLDVGLALLPACLGAIAGSFAAWRAGPWMRWAAQAAGFILGAALEFGSGDPDMRALLPIVLVCAISVTAGLGAGGGRAGFWSANARLAANLAVALAALIIAITGGTLIFSALEALLGLGSDKVDEALLELTSLFAFPLFWLSLARLDPVPEDNLLLRAVSVATDALLIPLVLAFGAVIHAYALRIAVAGELPNGQIGWIVPVYVSVGYGVYCVASGPAPRLPRVRAFFHRAWIPSTLAPLLLLGLALAVRLRAYGVTEERYFLLLVAIAVPGSPPPPWSGGPSTSASCR